jgi:hypothetical protein
MNIRREDLKRLRVPASVAAMLVAIGAAAIVVTDHRLGVAIEARESVRAQRAAAQERVSKVSEEEREIRESLIFYQRMQRQGMIGQENRLDWIDSIARIKSQRKLFEIKYSIEPQKPLDYPGIVPTKGGEFVVSRMKLDMLLLHEEDLLNFLSDLRATDRFHVSVRHCSMSRIERGPVPPGQALMPRLRSECQIDLITVDQEFAS